MNKSVGWQLIAILAIIAALESCKNFNPIQITVINPPDFSTQSPRSHPYSFSPLPFSLEELEKELDDLLEELESDDNLYQHHEYDPDWKNSTPSDEEDIQTSPFDSSSPG